RLDDEPEEVLVAQMRARLAETLASILRLGLAPHAVSLRVANQLAPTRLERDERWRDYLLVGSGRPVQRRRELRDLRARPKSESSDAAAQPVLVDHRRCP